MCRILCLVRATILRRACKLKAVGAPSRAPLPSARNGDLDFLFFTRSLIKSDDVLLPLPRLPHQRRRRRRPNIRKVVVVLIVKGTIDLLQPHAGGLVRSATMCWTRRASGSYCGLLAASAWPNSHVQDIHPVFMLAVPLELCLTCLCIYALYNLTPCMAGATCARREICIP